MFCDKEFTVLEQQVCAPHIGKSSPLAVQGWWRSRGREPSEKQWTGDSPSLTHSRSKRRKGYAGKEQGDHLHPTTAATTVLQAWPAIPARDTFYIYDHRHSFLVYTRINCNLGSSCYCCTLMRDPVCLVGVGGSRLDSKAPEGKKGAIHHECKQAAFLCRILDYRIRQVAFFHQHASLLRYLAELLLLLRLFLLFFLSSIRQYLYKVQQQVFENSRTSE